MDTGNQVGMKGMGRKHWSEGVKTVMKEVIHGWLQGVQNAMDSWAFSPGQSSPNPRFHVFVCCESPDSPTYVCWGTEEEGLFSRCLLKTKKNKILI